MWHGPFRIRERINEFTYKVGLDDGVVKFFPLIHISRLKPYISRTERPDIHKSHGFVKMILLVVH